MRGRGRSPTRAADAGRFRRRERRRCRLARHMPDSIRPASRRVHGHLESADRQPRCRRRLCRCPGEDRPRCRSRTQRLGSRRSKPGLQDRTTAMPGCTRFRAHQSRPGVQQRARTCGPIPRRTRSAARRATRADPRFAFPLRTSSEAVRERRRRRSCFARSPSPAQKPRNGRQVTRSVSERAEWTSSGQGASRRCASHRGRRRS